MNKSILILVAAIALAAVAYFVLRDDASAPAVQDNAPASMGTPPSGQSVSARPQRNLAAGDAEQDRDKVIEDARAQADKGDYADAMAGLAPQAVAGDEEALALMGELNVLRLEKQREERIDYLVKQLSTVPEENTAQRYAIVRELSQLKPRDSELMALRELYGELLIDEVEAGLLSL